MLPVPGRADRERALHREHELVVQRQQLDEAVDRELVRRHGRLGDRIGPVDVLAVELAPLEVVAQQPRGAARARRSPAGRPGRARSRCAVKKKRPFGGVAALSKPRFWRTPRVAAAFGQEGGRDRQRSELAAVEAELAHPRVDQPVREALGRDHERVVLRQRQALRVDAERGERLAGGVAKRGHGDDLHGGSAAADADPQRVEAHVDLVVRERRRRRRGSRRRRCWRGRRTSCPGTGSRSGRSAGRGTRARVDGAACAGPAATSAIASSRTSLVDSGLHPVGTVLRQQIDREGDREHDATTSAATAICTPPSTSHGVRSLRPCSASAASSSVFSIGSAMPRRTRPR